MGVAAAARAEAAHPPEREEALGSGAESAPEPAAAEDASLATDVQVWDFRTWV